MFLNAAIATHAIAYACCLLSPTLVWAREAALVAARETTRMRSELLARTSHEIRTPLHGILGSADLLADTNLDAAQRRWVEAIVDCGASLLEIVNAVLDLEQARAGRMRGRLAPFDPTLAATGVIALFEGAAARRGLALRMVSQGVPTCVLGDVLRTQQIVRTHVSSILEKLGAASRAEATAIAIRRGLVQRGLRDPGQRRRNIGLLTAKGRPP